MPLWRWSLRRSEEKTTEQSSESTASLYLAEVADTDSVTMSPAKCTGLFMAISQSDCHLPDGSPTLWSTAPGA